MRLGIDTRRLVHAMPDQNGIQYQLPHLVELSAGNPSTGSPALSPQAAAEMLRNTQRAMRDMAEKTQTSSAKGKNVAPEQNNTLYTTSAGLAAMALGAGDADAVSPELAPRIMQGHLLLAFFKALQPGVFMLSGQDLAGVLPLSWYAMVDAPREWDVAMTARGAYSFSGGSSVLVTGQGVAKAKTVYAPLETQVFDTNSFASRLSRLLALRARLGVAEGRLYGRFLTRNPGTVALIVQLPSQGKSVAGEAAPAPRSPEPGIMPADFSDNKGQLSSEQRNQEARKLLGGKILEAEKSDGPPVIGESALLLVCNFSQKEITESLDISASPLLRQLSLKGAPTLVTESDSNRQSWQNSVHLTLGPWQGAAILVGRAPR
jgi:hypothetical protein